MKKLVLVAITPFICFAQMDDYLPLSEFSDDKKIEYNFTDKQKKQELKKEEPTVKVITKEEKTVIKPVSEYKEEIVQKPIKQEVQVIEVRKSILNDEVKQEDVLENKRDFKITLTSTANFYDVEFGNSYSDKDTAIENSIKISDDKHALAFTYLNMSNKFLNSITVNTKMYSLKYFYNYINNINNRADLTISANYLDFDASLLGVTCNSCHEEKFLSTGINADYIYSDDVLVNYGLDIGMNDNIKYIYAYNLNLIYNFHPNIALNIGYKGRSLKTKDNGNFEYSGLVTGVQATF